MKSKLLMFAGVFVLSVLISSQAALAQRESLRVFCSNGIRAAVEQLRPAAENAIGRELSIEFSASTMLQRQVNEGASFDLAILTPNVIAELAGSGRLDESSIVDIASSDLAVGIRAGAAKTDVSTADGMKNRLLTARTLTWTDGGAAGPSVLAMFNGLGIAEQLQSKIVLQTVPGRPAISVAEGENELMFAPLSEIQTVPGVELLGRFPAEFQRPVVMTAGISVMARDVEGATELIAFLTSAEATQAMTANGMDLAANR